jgi:hypothetical protein
MKSKARVASSRPSSYTAPPNEVDLQTNHVSGVKSTLRAFWTVTFT